MRDRHQSPVSVCYKLEPRIKATQRVFEWLNGSEEHMSMLRIVHYLNQFFAGLGSEAQADVGPGKKPGAVGPARALQQALGDRGEVVATVYCGDNRAAEQPSSINEVV